MIDEFAVSIQKKQSIAAPFRRKLFEPYDNIIYNTIGNRPLRPPSIQNPQGPVPIEGENGKKLYRLSDVKLMIEAELKKKEEEIREKFMNEFKTELLKNAVNKDHDHSDKHSDLSNDSDPDDSSKFIFY